MTYRSGRLEICQKIYMTGFSGQKFYTLKVRKLRLFLLKEKQHKCINISYLSRLFVKTRPKPAYGRQGLDWIVGPRYSFLVFSTKKNFGNQPETMRNHETTLKTMGNQPKTMKNQETILKNHGNQPKPQNPKTT